ncbi:MAG: 2-amino-3,7-dideoxy-D-threo-hept-6-ulosonate synthase [Candidatus Helarchaeota archaeon]
MSLIGKAVRLERIMNRNTGKTIIVPLDHGMTVGPIKGIINLRDVVNQVAEGGANAVIEHIGSVFFGHRKSGRDIGLIVHLSASTNLSPNPNNKTIVTSVEDALIIGADGVSVHINIGDESEAQMLKDLGRISSACRRWGMPLLAMMYPRGDKISDEHGVEYVKIAARVAAELGVDIVKTNYTGSIDTFKEVVKGCPKPVIIAGGPRVNTFKDVLIMTKDSLEAGGSGIAFGRNIFQSTNPMKAVKALSRITHENWDIEETLREFNSQ